MNDIDKLKAIEITQPTPLRLDQKGYVILGDSNYRDAILANKQQADMLASNTKVIEDLKTANANLMTNYDQMKRRADSLQNTVTLLQNTPTNPNLPYIKLNTTLARFFYQLALKANK